jgi:acetyl esterase/lipase
MKPIGILALALLVTTAYSQDFVRKSDVVYMKQDGAAFTMDVFRPAKQNGIALVFMVSGGWVSNHNSINSEFAKQCTDRGFTVFQVVHGAQPRYKVPEIVKQVQRAVRFVRSHASEYGVNPNKLAISGGSAGGHLSLMIASLASPGNPGGPDPVERESAAVNSVGVFYPPTDFMNYGKDGFFAFDNPLLMATYGRAFLDDPKTAAKDKMLEVGKSMSPLTFMTKAMPPTFLVHGDADLLVPIQQSEITIKKLKELGVKNELVRVPGKGHGWEGMEVQVNLILDWFEKTLK